MLDCLKLWLLETKPAPSLSTLCQAELELQWQAHGTASLLTFTQKALDAGVMGGSIKVLRKVRHSDRSGEDTVGLKNKSILKKQTF